jgi:hypothetical protein
VPGNGSVIHIFPPNNPLFISNLPTTTLQCEMPVISDFDPVAQVVESLFIQAWSLFEESKFDEVSARLPLFIYSQTNTYTPQANTLSQKLLLEPRMGRLHRAGLHVILAHSPDDYVWHADEAVRMYENMYTNDMPPPTPEQAEDIKELPENAKSVQVKARIDSEALKKKRPTREEERLWIEQQIVAAFEQWEKGLQDDEGDEIEDDEAQNEGDGSDVKEEPVVKEEPAAE